METLLCIKYIALMEARDGRKYINTVLFDSTGNLESRIWQNAEEHAKNFSNGDFVQVKGKLNLFQGRKQFVVQKISKVNLKEVNPDDYIPKALRPPEDMYAELLAIVEKANDYYIKNLLLNILEDEEIQRRLKLWPAGKSIHHAYRSGLLEHILSCAQMAETLSPRYQCNFNYVLAGCILHDLCKIYELSEGVQVEYTDEGKLIGHLVKGLEILDRFSYRIKSFPYSMRIHLKHILLSHHGEYQYGSPKIPQTSEAMLVHQIDLMDSKMNSFATIKQTDSYGVDWSHYVKHLDRMVYKLPLPTFTEPLPEKEKENEKERKQHPSSKPLKQNLANLLRNYKVAKTQGSSPMKG